MKRGQDVIEAHSALNMLRREVYQLMKMGARGSNIIPLLPPCDVSRHCKSSRRVSHSGFGSRISLLGPDSLRLSQWLRDMCRTASTLLTRCSSGSGLTSRD